MLLAIATVAGAVASLVGLYALHQGRTSRRVKLLAYETTPAVPLASASPLEADYKLSILYERPDAPAEQVEAAYITYLRFANFGREPIRAVDIAPANRLRVEAEVDGPGEVLDISLAADGRSVTALRIEGLINFKQNAVADVVFDFLDYHDGGVVRVLSTARPKAVKLVGDIIGMPEGISRSDEPPARGMWGRVCVALWLSGELGAIAMLAFAFRWTVGTWENVWLMALPVPALILPGVVAVIVGDTIWPSNRRQFPGALALPTWLGFHVARGFSVGGPPPYLFEPLIDQPPTPERGEGSGD
jgi:hypothetical protein